MRRCGRGCHKRYWQIVVVAVSVVMLAAIMLYAHVEERQIEAKLQEIAAIERQNRKDAEEASKLTLFYDSSVDLLKDISAQEILNHDSISQTAKFVSGYSSDAAVSFSLSDITPSIDKDKLCMVVFEIYTEESAAKIAVQIDGTTSYYYITKEPNVFYLPIISFDTFSITLVSDFQNVYIGNLSVIETEELSSEIKYGQYELQKVEVYEGNRISDLVGREILVNGDNVYYLTKNALVTGTIIDGEFIQYGQISGLGATVHEAFISEDTIVVTCRENDVYFVDVSDLASPTIISTYDSLDLATGVDVCGNYVFICSRYFGVELVDSSDIENPRLSSIISTGGECIDCVYKAGYLYISNWNLKQIWVYDVSNPNTPKKTCVIDTDGSPYGITVNGDKLFVATGHNSASSSSAVLDGGYGAGHGMEIYDISEPEKISWISTVKIDGRLLYRAVDSWGVYVSGNYAFLSSTYAGIYIYDVSDPNNPVRMGRISTKIEAGSENYSYTESETSIFPYNVNSYMEDPISSIAFIDGGIYLAGQYTGLYSLAYDDVSFVEEDAEGVLVSYDGSYFDDMKDASLKNSDIYINGYCINACDTNGEYVFLACGNHGIEIIDNNQTLVNTINTPGSVQDIVIDGDYAYVAEGNYGIEVYRVNGYSLELVSDYQCKLVSETVTQIRISGVYMIAQDGWTRIKTFDISDPYNIISIEDFSTGTMYLKNLINTSLDSGILGFESSKEIKIYSTANNLSEMGAITNVLYGERDGMCDYDGNIIAIKENGYVVFTEEDIKNNTDLSTLIVYSCGDDYKLKGKVTCFDGVMVVVDTVGKRIAVVNINDLTNPKITEYFSVDGNPMPAKITEEYIYVPLCYQGLLIISR